MRGSWRRPFHAGLAIAFACIGPGCKHSTEEAPPPSSRVDGGSSTPPPVGNPDDVAGTNIDIYITAKGDVRVPQGPTDYQLSALVPKPDGSFTTIAGLVSADGTFRIPVVPQGTYYLRY